MHEPHRNSLPLHSVEVEEDRSSLETNESSRDPYDTLTVDGKVLKSKICWTYIFLLSWLIDFFIFPLSFFLWSF